MRWVNVGLELTKSALNYGRLAVCLALHPLRRTSYLQNFRQRRGCVRDRISTSTCSRSRGASFEPSLDAACVREPFASAPRSGVSDRLRHVPEPQRIAPSKQIRLSTPTSRGRSVQSVSGIRVSFNGGYEYRRKKAFSTLTNSPMKAAALIAPCALIFLVRFESQRSLRRKFFVPLITFRSNDFFIKPPSMVSVVVRYASTTRLQAGLFDLACLRERCDRARSFFRTSPSAGTTRSFPCHRRSASYVRAEVAVVELHRRLRATRVPGTQARCPKSATGTAQAFLREFPKAPRWQAQNASVRSFRAVTARTEPYEGSRISYHPLRVLVQPRWVRTCAITVDYVDYRDQPADIVNLSSANIAVPCFDKREDFNP